MKVAYLGLCSLLLHTSCDALWHSFRVPNARACEQASTDVCGPGMFCDRVLNECVVDSAPSPIITSASPAQGPTSGGIVIALDGANFVAGATVQVGGVSATQVTVVSSTRLTFVLPANPGALGTVPIVVNNPDGHQGSRTDLFAYYLSAVSFGTITPFASGSDGPYIIGIGDFNSDGKRDIAALHSPGTSLNTLFGDGTGRFTSGKSSLISGGAQGLAIADFNRDGRADIAIAATNVYTFLGKSDGSLDNPGMFAAGNGPVSIVAGDFNEDGKPDLAAAARGGGDAAVLIGDGQGGFANPVLYSLSATADPLAVVTADFNRDTHLDLAVADPTDGAVHILLGDGKGTFSVTTHVVTGRDQRGLTAGDINGDGKSDLVVANGQEGSLSVLLGDGAGGFGGPSHIQIGAANLEFDATATLADIDGDKNLDILYTNAADPQVVLLPGKGDGTFPQQVKIPVGTLPTSLQLFDWNGDGKLDLTVCDYGDDAIGILLNTSR